MQWKTLLSAFLFSPSIWIWGYFDRVLKQELPEYGFDFFSIRGNAFDRISDSIVLVVISMALPSELDGGEDPSEEVRIGMLQDYSFNFLLHLFFFIFSSKLIDETFEKHSYMSKLI